jgi:hypothetical protein
MLAELYIHRASILQAEGEVVRVLKTIPGKRDMMNFHSFYQCDVPAAYAVVLGAKASFAQLNSSEVKYISLLVMCFFF